MLLQLHRFKDHAVYFKEVPVFLQRRGASMLWHTDIRCGVSEHNSDRLDLILGCLVHVSAAQIIIVQAIMDGC